MSEAIEPIMSGMMATLSSCAAPARKPRLQLLEQILPRIDDVQFLGGITGELVLCTKDNNNISRSLAFRLLSQICQRYVDSKEQFEQALSALQFFFQNRNHLRSVLKIEIIRFFQF